MGNARAIKQLYISARGCAVTRPVEQGYANLGSRVGWRTSPVTGLEVAMACPGSGALTSRQAFRSALLHFSVELLDNLAERVFPNVHYPHFALRVFFGVAGMGRIDHDGLAEFSADRARRRLGWIRRPEHVPDLADCLNAFIHQGDALFGTRLFLILRGGFGRRAAGHKLDDVFELAVAENRSQHVAQLLLFGWTELESKFLFEQSFGFRRHHVLELRPQDFPHRPVKFEGLNHAHPVDFHGHDEKTRA